jgi:hypothetical protein
MWQLALEVIQAELDQLVTVDHGLHPHMRRWPAFPSFSMAAPGGGFREYYAIWAYPGNTCKETLRPVDR